MLAAIYGFLSALPQLLTMIQNGWGALVKISGNDPAGFIVKAGTAFDQLQKAQTQDDYNQAAQSIASLISNLPSK